MKTINMYISAGAVKRNNDSFIIAIFFTKRIYLNVKSSGAVTTIQMWHKVVRVHFNGVS